jgi:hypothetical protein
MGRTAYFANGLLLPAEARSRLRGMLPPIENRDPGDETADEEN